VSNAKRLPKPKKRVCRQCAAGNHTGHAHAVCPHCEMRIAPGGQHLHLVDGKRLVFRA
jgi:hypothetical protein